MIRLVAIYHHMDPCNNSLFMTMEVLEKEKNQGPKQIEWIMGVGFNDLLYGHDCKYSLNRFQYCIEGGKY